MEKLKDHQSSSLRRRAKRNNNSGKLSLKDMNLLMDDEMLRSLVHDGDLDPEAMKNIPISDLIERPLVDDDHKEIPSWSFSEKAMSALQASFERVRKGRESLRKLNMPLYVKAGIHEPQVIPSSMTYQIIAPPLVASGEEGESPKKRKHLFDEDDDDDEEMMGEHEEDEAGRMVWERQIRSARRRVPQEHAHYLPPMPRRLVDDMVMGRIFSDYQDLMDSRTFLGDLSTAMVHEMTSLSKYQYLEDIMWSTDVNRWSTLTPILRRLDADDVSICICNIYVVPKQRLLCLVLRLDPQHVFYAAMYFRMRLSSRFTVREAFGPSMNKEEVIGLQERYAVMRHDEFPQECWILRDSEIDNLGISGRLTAEQRETLQKELLKHPSWHSEKKSDDIDQQIISMKTGEDGTPLLMHHLGNSSDRLRRWWNSVGNGATEVKPERCVYFYCGCPHIQGKTITTTNQRPEKMYI